MRVGIALGSNVGDRAAHLRFAAREIAAIAQAPVLASRVYETVPVDCPGESGDFLNAALEVGWEADILTLLRALQRIEREAGRRRDPLTPRNAPRPLDLDLLYASGITLKTPDLTLPHPRLFERAFVLLPLRDIVPDLRIVPGGETISQFASRLPPETIFAIKTSQVSLD